MKLKANMISWDKDSEILKINSRIWEIKTSSIVNDVAKNILKLKIIIDLVEHINHNEMVKFIFAVEKHWKVH